jgi:hypothetical protein
MWSEPEGAEPLRGVADQHCSLGKSCAAAHAGEGSSDILLTGAFKLLMNASLRTLD